ncbi:MAG: hypothetical protein H7145_24555 [Akkermansiaceae bacterium]|nr:hypothetical protein [Armatimonadota bacterium]
MRTDRRGMIRSSIGAAVGMALWGGAGRTVAAQDAPPPSAPQPTTAPENPPTLAACLPFLDWDPAQRGPLLIVAPERAVLPGVAYAYDGTSTRVVMPASAEREPIRAGRNGFRLATISPRYRRKLTAIGSLSAAVPDTVAVLRYKNLPEPDIYAGVRPESRPQLLLATLSPAQWRRVLSPDGLGMGDLKRDQQAMFAGLFPETTKLYRTDPPAPGQEYGKTEVVPLHAVNMSAIRLRLYQDLHWSYLFKDAKGGLLHMGDSPSSNTEPTYRLERSDPFTMHYTYDYGETEVAKDVTIFGVDVLEAQPNRAKPSNIDYEGSAWNAGVSLADARKIGDLVTRIRKATGVELYADKRYADLPVHTRAAPNTDVRSGDLLKALALSVTGTFRRVASGSESAFVMTDDAVGSGIRFATLSDWIRGGEERLLDRLQQLGKAAREANYSDTAPWALREDMAPSAALLERLAHRRGLPPLSIEKMSERLIPLAELPKGIQERVRSQQDSRRAQAAASPNDNHQPIREDGVLIDVKAKLAVVLPGIGSIPLPIEDMNFSDNEQGGNQQEMAWYRSGVTPPDMVAPLPVRIEARWFPRRFVVVTVKSTDDAREAARLAHTRHFTGLVFSFGDQSPKEIAGWVSVARETAPDVAVWLKTSLLRQNGAKDSDSEATGMASRLDRNILDETYTQSLRRPAAQNPFYGGFAPSPPDDGAGDYLAVGDPDALQAVRSRVVSLVSGVPGVAGLLFTDITPPGYMNPSMGTSDRELGYTPLARLAFLREAGSDPIDLSPVGELEQHGWMPGINRMQTRVRLPYFPDLGPNVSNSTINGQPATALGAKDLYPRWYEFRAKQLSAAHLVLRAAIKSESPCIEVLTQHLGMWGMVMEWPLPTAIPTTAAAPPAKPPPPAKPAAPPAFQWLPFSFSERVPEGAAPMNRSERFARQMARSVAWLSKPTPEAKAAMASTKYGLLLDLSRASVADTDEILSQIIIGPEPK